MANDQTIYDDEERANEQEMMEMLAEYQYAKSQGFIDWIYKNRQIGNGHQIVNALEDGDLQAEYIKEVGLPEDTELEV